MTNRVDALRGILVGRALDAVLITHPSNRFYLSGYSGEDAPPNESAGVLLISAETASLLTGSVNEEWARAEAVGFDVQTWTRPWAKTVAEKIRSAGWARVGIEDQAILYATYRDLGADLGANAELVPLGDSIDGLRLVKSTDELEAIQAAVAITDAAFVAATTDLQPGTTERELAWRIERELRERGADGMAFTPIVAAGSHGARPHHNATERPIGEGEPVVIDMGGRLNGYNGDLTRTIWLGEPSARLCEIYQVVLEANQRAIKEIRPGMTGQEADAVAREIIDDAGYGDFFTHGLGHGVGVRVHESPSASKTSDDVLRPGQILTIEPGIYIPEWGGVRIEDLGVIEERGVRILTRAPKAKPPSAATAVPQRPQAVDGEMIPSYGGAAG